MGELALVFLSAEQCAESLPGVSPRTIYRLMRRAGATCGAVTRVLVIEAGTWHAFLRKEFLCGSESAATLHGLQRPTRGRSAGQRARTSCR
jgi:hypothetical protein